MIDEIFNDIYAYALRGNIVTIYRFEELRRKEFKFYDIYGGGQTSKNADPSDTTNREDTSETSDTGDTGDITEKSNGIEIPSIENTETTDTENDDSTDAKESNETSRGIELASGTSEENERTETTNIETSEGETTADAKETSQTEDKDTEDKATSGIQDKETTGSKEASDTGMQRRIEGHNSMKETNGTEEIRGITIKDGVTRFMELAMPQKQQELWTKPQTQMKSMEEEKQMMAENQKFMSLDTQKKLATERKPLTLQKPNCAESNGLNLQVNPATQELATLNYWRYQVLQKIVALNHDVPQRVLDFVSNSLHTGEQQRCQDWTVHCNLLRSIYYSPCLTSDPLLESTKTTSLAVEDRKRCDCERPEQKREATTLSSEARSCGDDGYKGPKLQDTHDGRVPYASVDSKEVKLPKKRQKRRRRKKSSLQDYKIGMFWKPRKETITHPKATRQWQ